MKQRNPHENKASAEPKAPQCNVTPANEPPRPDPNAPLRPEFSPPGEQQSRQKSAEPQQLEVPAKPSVHEIPNRPAHELPQRGPDGPDRERA